MNLSVLSLVPTILVAVVFVSLIVWGWINVEKYDPLSPRFNQRAVIYKYKGTTAYDAMKMRFNLTSQERRMLWKYVLIMCVGLVGLVSLLFGVFPF